MSSLPAFSDIALPEPDADALRASAADLEARARAAASVAELAAVVEDLDAQRQAVESWASWAQVRFAQDTADPDNQARRARLEQLGPLAEALDVRVLAAILDSPHRGGLAERTGSYVLRLWDADRRGHDDRLIDDQTRELARAGAYTRLIGGAQVEFRGELLGLPALRALAEDPDRQTRHDALAATWGWFAEHSDEITQIYADLVELRAGMAATLGDPDFTATGYRRMRRLDWGPDDAASFRDEIRREVVPLVAELQREQSARLGIDPLMAWDLPLMDPAGNPRPQGDPAWQTDRAADLMQRLHPDMGSFFAMMRHRGLLDLESRPGKAPGGFCAYIGEPQAPFVFANMNGTAGDARVFTHELGHAMQVWSSRALWPGDLRWPTYEAAEVHSMSLELLSWPHLELFFGDDAGRYRRNHLEGALTALPWLAALDDFQHRIYADPGADPFDLWRDVESTWLPGLRWGDIAHGARGGRWQSVPHLFQTPFYTLDYALAQTVSLQLWLLARRDPTAAIDRWLALCRQGGSKPFVELVQGAGLRSPFEPGVLADVVAEARAFLDAAGRD